MNKNCEQNYKLVRRRNQIPSTSGTKMYFANNMLIAFCVQPPAIFLHSGGKFPAVTKNATSVTLGYCGIINYIYKMMSICVNSRQNFFKLCMSIAIWYSYTPLFLLFSCNMDSFGIVASIL